MVEAWQVSPHRQDQVTAGPSAAPVVLVRTDPADSRRKATCPRPCTRGLAPPVTKGEGARSGSPTLRGRPGWRPGRRAHPRRRSARSRRERRGHRDRAVAGRAPGHAAKQPRSVRYERSFYPRTVADGLLRVRQRQRGEGVASLTGRRRPGADRCPEPRWRPLACSAAGRWLGRARRPPSPPRRKRDRPRQAPPFRHDAEPARQVIRARPGRRWRQRDPAPN